MILSDAFDSNLEFLIAGLVVVLLFSLFRSTSARISYSSSIY